MSRTANRQGGTNASHQGILKRPLPEVTLFNLGNYDPPTVLVETTVRARMRGISPNFNLAIACGISMQGSNAFVPYPALPGTFKVTPFMTTGQGSILYLKTLTLSPQTLPACYTLGPGLGIGATADNPDFGTQLADGAILECTIDPAQYATLALTGNVICQITATYNGGWWDIETIEQMIAQLTVDAPTPQRIFTIGA